MTNKEIDELRIGDTIEIKIPEKKWSWLKFDYVPGEPKTKKVMISYISYDHGMFWYNDTDCLGRNDLMLNGKLVRKIIDTFDDDFFEKRIEEKKKFEEASKKINETLSKRSLSSIGTKYEYLVGRVIDSGEDLGKIEFLCDGDRGEFWLQHFETRTVKFDYLEAAIKKARTIKDAFVVMSTVNTHISKKFELYNDKNNA